MTERSAQVTAGERYERLDRIATGGMGEVWRARDTVLGREVAVKVLKPEYADDPAFRERFAAEARHAAALHHPHIAALFDYGELEQDRTPYLVMELVDGRPLSELLAGGRRLDPEQARAVLGQAAEALGAAHAAGVVHRDVKPANILVTSLGQVKITDFGIARAADSAAITRTGEVVGTPHYLSPEQASGESATSASDVYALGVVLHECLAGRRPFERDSAVATALAHLRDEPPPLPDDVPHDLAAVTRRALAKDPRDRYADGAALAAALTTVATAPATAPTSTQVLEPAAAPLAQTQVVPAPRRPRDRSRWPLYAMAGLAVLLLVVLVATRLTADPGGSEAATTDTTREPAASPSGSPSPTGSTRPSSAGSVRVDPAAYVGRPVDRVRADLRALGLATSVSTASNDGTHEAGTVADLAPTGAVREGRTIELQVWDTAAPAQTGPGGGPDKGTGGPGTGGQGGGPDKGKGKGKKG